MKNRRKVVRELPIRWSKGDLRDDMPKRFQRALDRNGAAQATTVRTLVRCYVKEVERLDKTALERAAKRTVKQQKQ